MIPNGLPVSQFFEGAGADTPPALFIVPVVLSVILLAGVDLVASLGALVARRAEARRAR